MKWFFAINEASAQFPAYAEMLKVAVYSARQHTTLEPCCLYDGAENALTAWMRGQGVTLFLLRSRFYDALLALAMQREYGGRVLGGSLEQSQITDFGAGTFLRVEIPALAKQQGLTDRYILYTDLDVLFVRDVVPELETMHPRYFAVASEFVQDDWLRINAGVMLVNLDGMREKDAAFTAFCFRYLPRFVADSFDQAAFRAFFNPIARWRLALSLPAVLSARLTPLQEHRTVVRLAGLWQRRIGVRLGEWAQRRIPAQWDRLPAAFNWKTYWGLSPEAAVVHFHGPKPTDADRADTFPPGHNYYDYIGDNYFAWCRLWQETLSEAEAAT